MCASVEIIDDGVHGHAVPVLITGSQWTWPTAKAMYSLRTGIMQVTWPLS